jgi:hypothetical protein
MNCILALKRLIDISFSDDPIDYSCSYVAICRLATEVSPEEVVGFDLLMLLQKLFFSVYCFDELHFLSNFCNLAFVFCFLSLDFVKLMPLFRIDKFILHKLF